MTNVRDMNPVCRNHRCRPEDVAWNDRLIARTATGLLLAAALVMTSQRTAAQVPSGAATGSVIDINRSGLGFQVRGGHAAGGTVGRQESASHLSMSPYVNFGDGLLFGDTRLTYGNEGGLAWSFGGGYRQYVPAWDAVIGANIYADRDSRTDAHFRGWGAGAEILAHSWEMRGNWYQPTGTRSFLVESRANPGSAAFSGNNVLFDRIDTFAESLQGWDGEVGWLLPGQVAERFDARVFGGAYYYEGTGIADFAGWSTRLQTDIGDWLELGLKVTDDEVFNTTVSFTAMVHFGGFQSQDHTKRSGMQRMAEPVRRSLNLPVAVTDITAASQVAIAPDGTPLTIIHVNSAAPPGGTGTVTSPFSSLQNGLGFVHPEVTDVIFTHAGSAFNAAPDNIVTLNNDQSLFGEGLIRVENTLGAFVENRQVTNLVAVQGLGDLQLPDSPTFTDSLAALGPDPFGPLAATTPLDPSLLRPMLSNTAGTAVTLGTNSRFGGFIVDSPSGDGVLINTVAGTVVRDTLIQNAGGRGIYVLGTPANSTTSIVDTIIDNATGNAFQVEGGAGAVGFTATSTLLDPAYGAIFNSSGAAVQITNKAGGSVNMLGATIDDTGGTGINIADNTNTAVVIDNANIVNSTATGISITNVGGTGAGSTYSFRNTVRSATTVNNATDESVLVSGVPATSTITFDNLDIISPQSHGISLVDLGGTFSFVRDLTIGAPPNQSPASAIRMVNSTATGIARFGGNVTVVGISPQAGATPPVAGQTFTNGIELAGNATGSQFSILGITTITGATGNSIGISNNDGSVLFMDNVNVRQRGPSGVGINIDDSTGVISFGGTSTTVEHLPLGAVNANIAFSTAPGVSITNSQSPVSFEQLNVYETLTGAAVFLNNNIAGPMGSARLFFNELNINDDPLVVPQAPGPGLVADMNSTIIINDGILNTDGAAAVDISNSGIDITFESVSVENSPDFGIRLVETNVLPSLNMFTITGNGTPASGGIIQTTAPGVTTLDTGGIVLNNAGDVSLNHVLLDSNNRGIVVANSGLAIDDEQYLRLSNVQVFDSELNAINATNLHELTIGETSEFIGNGEAAVLADEGDTILLQYTEARNPLTTTLFNEFDYPYLVDIGENTQLEGDQDDLLVIRNSLAAEGAHIDIRIEDSNFLVTDNADIAGDEVEQAIRLEWDGVARTVIQNNTIELLGAPGANAINVFGQDGIVIETTSITDEMLLSILGNTAESQSQPQSAFLRLSTQGGPTSALIANNGFQFDANNSDGFIFNLGPNVGNRLISIQNNTMLFLGDGGSGMIFNRIQSPQRLAIGGNNIGLTDFSDIAAFNGLPEVGMEFVRVVGTVDLLQGLDNQILVQPGGGNIFADIDTLFDLLPTQANGTILINGAPVP